MRILLVELNRDFRGGQHQALLLLQGLLSRGHTAELVTVNNSILAENARKAGITVHGVNSRFRRLGAALVIRRLVDEGRVDIVHANEPHALTAAWLARSHRHVPLVVARRVIYPLSANSTALRRYRDADRILAVSRCVRDAVLTSGLPPKQVTVVPVGVSVPSFRSDSERNTARHKFNVGQEDILVGCVGAFTPDKGHDFLIRAFAQVRRQFPHCKLILAGDGPENSKLQELARELKLGSSVQFMGFVKDVDAIYAAIDLFVFPGLADALPTVLLAAMSYGLPVVGLARGGVTEVLDDGRNGLLVNEPDPQKLAAAILRLLANSAEALRMGNTARESIISGFSADHMVEQTLQVYEEAIAARSQL